MNCTIWPFGFRLPISKKTGFHFLLGTCALNHCCLTRKLCQDDNRRFNLSLSLVINPAIEQDAEVASACRFTSETSLWRHIPHSAILNNHVPRHLLLRRPNHCSLGVLLLCQLSACSEMLLPNSTGSKLNLLWEQGQIFNCSRVDGQHQNVSCHFSGSVLRRKLGK